jgi:hypothetical protein
MQADGRIKARYHRLVLRFGGYRNKTAKKKAIVAVAHTLILMLITWHVPTEGVSCADLGADFYTRRIEPQQEARRLIARLAELGHKITIEPARRITRKTPKPLHVITSRGSPPPVWVGPSLVVGNAWKPQIPTSADTTDAPRRSRPEPGLTSGILSPYYSLGGLGWNVRATGDWIVSMAQQPQATARQPCYRLDGQGADVPRRGPPSASAEQSVASRDRGNVNADTDRSHS